MSEQMQITTEHLVYMIGLKDIEINQLRNQLTVQVQRNSQLEKQIQELKPKEKENDEEK